MSDVVGYISLTRLIPPIAGRPIDFDFNWIIASCYVTHLQGVGADVEVVMHEGEGVVGLLRVCPARSARAASLRLLVRHVVELHGAP